jgi:hypothetical protein
MAAKQGPDVLFCMPIRTKRILLVSLMIVLSVSYIGFTYDVLHNTSGHGKDNLVPLRMNSRILGPYFGAIDRVLLQQ